MLDNSQLKIKTVAYLKLIITIFLWAGVYHVAKFLIRVSDIYTISFLRFLMSSLVIVPFYLSQRGVLNGLKTLRDNALILMPIGFCGAFLYNLFFLSAETYIPANDVAILFAFAPCMTAILSSIFLKQKINLISFLGILIALAGTIGVINENSTTCGKFFCTQMLDSGFSVGEQLSLWAAFVMAVYNILNKKALMKGLDSLTIITGSSIFGVLSLFCTFLIYTNNKTLIFHVSWEFWVSMIYLALLATVLSYQWYSDSIKHIGIYQTVVFQNALPFATILLGVLLLGQSIKFVVLLFGIIIVLGVLITNYASLEINNSTLKD